MARSTGLMTARLAQAGVKCTSLAKRTRRAGQPGVARASLDKPTDSTVRNMPALLPMRGPKAAKAARSGARPSSCAYNN